LSAALTPGGGTVLEVGVRELPPIELEGFDPAFGCGEYTWGPHVYNGDVFWKDHQYHAEMLSWHYHDYLGTHAFLQVWDYAQQDDPDQRWQYVLLLHRPERHVNAEGDIVGGDWAWTIRSEWEAETGVPGFAEVGGLIDLWLKAPDVLRFIIE
jgi:hypothetical protein